MKFLRLLGFGSLLLCHVAIVGAQDPPAPAKELFERYVALDNAFDPAIADLYADDAKIEITRIAADGEKRVAKIPARDYKEQIRVSMPIAKITGDKSVYEKVKYQTEGERVRITCERSSGSSEKASALSLLVGPGPEGRWLIFEELAESHR